MPYSFPPRSAFSDLHAANVVKALDDSGCAKGFMISVLITAAYKIYVAPSGSNRESIERALREKLAFLSGLKRENAQSKMSKREFEREKKSYIQQRKELGNEDKKVILAKKAIDYTNNLNKLEKKGGLYKESLGVYIIVTTPSPLSRILIDPDRTRLSEKKDREHPLVFPEGRYCSEPKVISAAGRDGETLEAMTTIWYGSDTDPATRYVAGTHNVNGTTITIANPCDFCSFNESRIMMYAVA